MRRKMNKQEMSALTKFALIGVIGFCVDAGLLYLAVYVLSAPLITARVVSILVSVLVTWVLNRNWTFYVRNVESIWLELLKYLGSRSVGAATNILIFSALVSMRPAHLNTPVVATPLSSAMTMLINYIMVRLLIYKPR